MRVETERRQRGLEAELQQAEVARKERAFALRYHKIKFFGAWTSLHDWRLIDGPLTRTPKGLAQVEAS